MAKDAVATMGTILTDDVGGRDAVHVAVISAEADGVLMPGQHVGIKSEPADERLVVGRADDLIGIVDPFLPVSVRNGQRFWLYLYPRTITSLRHNWTHPAFADAPLGQFYAAPSEQLASMQFINNVAGRYGFTGERMIEAAKEYLRSGEGWNEGPVFEGERVPEGFWSHFERVTGQVVPDNDRGDFFACSC